MHYRVIGDRDSILGYQLAGVEGFAVHDANAARAAFRAALADNTCAVLTIVENAAEWIEPEIESHRLSGRQPLIAIVPGLLPATGRRNSLTEIVQQAVGVSSGRE
jgi:V/A-type H+/Na+-transporting ATPase subunit F